MDYERLKRAVEQISLTEEAEKRILDLEDRQREYHVRKKLVKRGLVAACTALFLLCVLCILPEKIKETPEWGITAYAKGTGAAQWISLKPGERVLLELDPVRNRYMMELDLPENYYYEKEINPADGSVGIMFVSKCGLRLSRRFGVYQSDKPYNTVEDRGTVFPVGSCY